MFSRFHNFPHHSTTQLEAALQQQTIYHSLILPDTVFVSKENFLLFRCQSIQQLIVIPANQSKKLFIFRIQAGVILWRLNIPVPQLLHDVHGKPP